MQKWFVVVAHFIGFFFCAHNFAPTFCRCATFCAVFSIYTFLCTYQFFFPYKAINARSSPSLSYPSNYCETFLLCCHCYFCQLCFCFENFPYLASMSKYYYVYRYMLCRCSLAYIARMSALFYWVCSLGAQMEHAQWWCASNMYIQKCIFKHRYMYIVFCAHMCIYIIYFRL